MGGGIQRENSGFRIRHSNKTSSMSEGIPAPRSYSGIRLASYLSKWVETVRGIC